MKNSQIFTIFIISLVEISLAKKSCEHGIGVYRLKNASDVFQCDAYCVFSGDCCEDFAVQ
jgi:hypothetical protein